jgi:DNA repair photolyase
MTEPNEPQQRTHDALPISGRGAQFNPHNRFLKLHVEEDLEQLEHDEEYLQSRKQVQTEYFEDDSQSILSENDSPDIPFRYSLNPYRGCAHGCAYCYARPSHEYLGLSAGLDFESKIFVKRRAAELLREALQKKSWVPQMIMMSGITDCYQPAERQFRITRSCIEVAAEFCQPLGIITKNALVARDIDLLSSLAAKNLTRVAISITSLDQSLTRVLEPRTSSPAARLRAVRELSQAGVPVTVMVAPLIPGLNDSEIPSILEAAKDHGATFAGYILLRLPLTVRPVFLDWLRSHFPTKSERVESLIRDTRDGQYNQSQFGDRMRGSGEYAEHLSQTFKLFAHRYGLARKTPPLDVTHFRPPRTDTKQMTLFDVD